MAESERVHVEIDGHRLAVSNLDKVLYPLVGFTKAQVIDYYVRIAPVMLPHIAGPRDHAAALARRGDRELLLREALPVAPARLGRHVSGAGRPPRRHRVLPARLDRGAGLDRESRRARDPRADVAVRRPSTRRRCWSSTSTPASRRRSSSARQVAFEIRDVLDTVGLQSLSEDLGQQGDAALRAAQHPTRARPCLRLRPRRRPAAREEAARSSCCRT